MRVCMLVNPSLPLDTSLRLFCFCFFSLWFSCIQDKWPDLLPTLLSNVTGEVDDKVKVATLQSLGYMCDDVSVTDSLVSGACVPCSPHAPRLAEHGPCFSFIVARAVGSSAMNDCE